jgi:hypothetical protein
MLASDRTKSVVLETLCSLQMDLSSTLDTLITVCMDKFASHPHHQPQDLISLKIYLLALIQYIHRSQLASSATSASESSITWHPLPKLLQTVLAPDKSSIKAIEQGPPYPAHIVFDNLSAMVDILLQEKEGSAILESLLGSAYDMKCYEVTSLLLSKLNRDYESSLSDLRVVAQRCELRLKLKMPETNSIITENAKELWLVFNHHFDKFLSLDNHNDDHGYLLLEQV